MIPKIMEFLKIYKGESQKLFTFFFVGVLLQAGVAIGISSSDALFLANVGAAKLPLLFVFMPVIMLLFTPVYSYIIEKYKIDRVFILTLGALFFGGIIIFLILMLAGNASRPAPVFYYGVKIYTYIWMLSLYTLFWNFVDEYFDILDAKRLFPILSGGISIGAVLGGGIVTLLSEKIGTEKLFLLWSLTSVTAIPLVMFIIKKWKMISESGDDETELSFIKQTSKIFSIMKSSRFITLINIVFFLIFFITTICEYQYLDIFSRNITEQQLAALFGKLFIFVNIFNLLVNIFMFNKLVAYTGVRNTALILPAAYIIAFLFLMTDYSFNSALFAFFTYQGILISIDLNNWNFIFNAVENRYKKQIRTFVEELMDPLATSIAGIFLLILTPSFTPRDISLSAIAVSVVFLLTVFLLRSNYRTSMVNNLKKGWLDFSKSWKELLADIDDKQLDLLEEDLKDKEPVSGLFSFYIICLKNMQRALNIFMDLLRKAPYNMQNSLRPLLSILLKKANYETDRAMLQMIEKEELYLEPGLTEQLVSSNLIQVKNIQGEALSSIEEKIAVIVSLWNSSNPSDGARAMEEINRMLRGNEENIIVAIRILGKLGQSKYVHFLVPYLENQSGEIRKEALRALAPMVDRDSSRILSRIYNIIPPGTHEERILALEIIDKINDSSCIIPVLAMGSEFTPFEKRRVEELLMNIGLKSVPTLIAIFTDSKYSFEARSLSARALGKLSFPQFEALYENIIYDEIIKAYKFLYFYSLLSGNSGQYNSLEVLSKFYNDVYSVIIEFILEMLTIGGRLPDYELIVSSIRSKNQKVVGNAIETLEQGVKRSIWKILLPLVDSRSVDEKIAFYNSITSKENLSINDIVSQALESPFPLECSIASQVLWEMEGESSFDRLQKLLENSTSGFFKETVMSLYRKHDGQNNLNVIDKLFFLSRSPFFSAVRISGLVAIARSSREIDFDSEKVFEKDTPMENLYMIIQGEVKLSNGNSIREPGGVFGNEGFFLSPDYKSDAAAMNLKALRIPKSGLISHIRVLPHLGIALLERTAVSG